MSDTTDVRLRGARGDGQSNDTQAIQQALDAAAGAGGGTVVLPAGTYLCGSLELRSNVTLRIEKNALLQASPVAENFRYFQSKVFSRMDVKPWRAFLYGEDLENVTLCGEGTIDGGGAHACFAGTGDNNPFRPYLLHLVNCREVLTDGLHLQNSAFWMQRYFSCSGVRVRGVTVWNHSNENNDGIDIDSCEDVTISDCRIDAMDDGICLKSEGERCCRNVTVTNCIVATHASAFKLGTGSVGGFRNVTFSNCVVRPSKATVMRHPLQAWGGLTGIDLGCVDGGAMESILFSNIAIEGVETPIFVRLGNRLSRNVAAQGYSTRDIPTEALPEGMIDGVTLSGITATGVGPICSVIAGYEGHPVRNVTLRDVLIRCARPGRPEDVDAAPDWDPKRYPVNRTVARGGLLYNGHNMPAFGLMARMVDGLTLDNVRFVPAAGEPRPGVLMEQVTDLHQNNVTTETVTTIADAAGTPHCLALD